MLIGAALIVISQCLDGHPSGAKAVLVMGIILCAFKFIQTIVEVAKKASEGWYDSSKWFNWT